MGKLGLLASSKGREQRIVMLGLDNAGKTTILYQLKMREVVQTTPTIGFNVETVKRGKLSFSVWDVGGQDQIRSLWRHYFLNTQAVIFVIDSSDAVRLREARDELIQVLAAPELAGAVLLVFANKQDVPHALSSAEITSGLDMEKIKNHQWHVQPACAMNGQGLEEGLDWLAERLKEKGK